MITLRDDLWDKYHDIPFNPELDTEDINREFVEVLTIHDKLRELMKQKGRWSYADFEYITKELSQFGFLIYMIEMIFLTYSPETWNALDEEYHKDIRGLASEITFKPIDEFYLDPIEHELFPFRVSKKGIEKHMKSDSTDDNWEIITNTPVIINSIGECVDDESYVFQIKYRTITGQVFKKWVEPKILLTSEMKVLPNFGLQFTDIDQKDMKKYFKLLIGQSNKFPLEITAFKNGWKKENTLLITGSYAHTGNGKKEILALTEEIATAYQKKGNKKEWIEVIKPLFEYNLIRLKCYATVTAFILRFLNVKTFVLHNFFESSGLKSISMQIAASLVGNPAELMKDASNTKVGIEKLLEYSTDTPVYFDETSNNKDFIDFIYLIGNEQGKGRGTKEGGIDKPGTWRTVVQTTGESPITKGSSVNTGLQMRTIEIHEGIPRLEAEYIEKLKVTLDENYGLFLDEIVQLIFIKKDMMKQFYKNVSSQFPKPATVFADRAKSYFVALAIGGYFLEIIFQRNEIPSKQSIDVCKEYYEKVVINDPIVPYGIRALQSTYQWTIRNKRTFEYSRELDPEERYDYQKGVYEIKGWITKEAIYYDPDKLEEYLTQKQFNFQRVIADWRKDEILDPHRAKDPKSGEMKYKSFKTNSMINGQRVTGIKISFHKLKEVLDLKDNEIYEVKTADPDKKIENVYVNLIESCSLYLAENPQYKNMNYTPEQVTDFFIRSEDREELLLYGKENILKAFEMCKKHR